jgi:enoyl-CoA hydratase
MPAATVRMVKQAVNATAGALHAATAFADADQNQVTVAHAAATTARYRFRGNR